MAEQLVRKWRRGLQYILVGLIGAVLGTTLALQVFAEQELALLDDMISRSVRPQWSEEKKVRALTAATYHLMKPRQQFFDGTTEPNIRNTWFRTVDNELLDARGSCGSFTLVLARLLGRAGIDYRVFQMYCDSTRTWGCHILLEANIDGKWRSVDPSYNIVFPVSAREVGRQWSSMKSLIPADYDPRYRYEDLRYTNWDKVPLVMPAVRWIMDKVAPGVLDTLSVRSYFLNSYRNAQLQLLALSALMFIAMLKLRRAQYVPGIDVLAHHHTRWLKSRDDSRRGADARVPRTRK